MTDFKMEMFIHTWTSPNYNHEKNISIKLTLNLDSMHHKKDISHMSLTKKEMIHNKCSVKSMNLGKLWKSPSLTLVYNVHIFI